MSRKKKPRGSAASRKGVSAQSKTGVKAARWSNHWRTYAVGATALLMFVGAVLYALFGRPAAPVAMLPSAQVVSATYVGTKVCTGCHIEEGEAWKGSDHALAMQHADTNNVLGNFDNAKFAYAGITSTFFKRDGKFFVNTDGPDGKLHDYEIKYTFGVTPLQQYLIEMPGVRFQALSIAWDSRPKERGGQRWFHLYPNERITHEDELHWTRPAQNWNFMCADCHSTELQKNYDPAADRFQTKWAEINVGCEACHGPGSRHLEWAKAKSGGRPATAEDVAKGLSARLGERRGVAWSLNATTGNAARSMPRTTEHEIEVCAQCHARRGQIADGYEAGKPFLDYYRPALLTDPLYYVDGQQRGEVYNWGSFLQSKMYASGVTCSDCHDPHSGKLRADGNVLCSTCHLPSKYDTATHHHHKPGSAGAACAGCHMPNTTYMVVDPRRDHSLRVPRPDLSVKFGTPNACNVCHSDRDTRWAAEQVNKWYGHNPQGYQRFAAGFAAANAGAPDAQAQLRAIAADSSHPAITRATALAQLNASLSQAAFDTVAAALRDRSSLVRFAALQSLTGALPDVRRRLAAPLLSDPLKAVRIETASLLAGVPAEQLSAEQRTAFARASAEYIASQRYNADRADARVNVGTFYANRGDPARAEEELKAALGLDPLFTPAYVNLADLYRTLGRDVDGEKLLREGLRAAPKSAMLHHALGLALVRLKRADAALAELERATILEPANARFSYVYAVALHSTGKTEAAITRLEKTLLANPNDADILAALASLHQARGDNTAAKKYADRLRTLTNE
jgi:Tfp pilus assembly protein PilF